MHWPEGMPGGQNEPQALNPLPSGWAHRRRRGVRRCDVELEQQMVRDFSLFTLQTEGKTAMKDVETIEVTAEYLAALRQQVGRQIDPQTAEVEWTYALTVDPYGDCLDVPEEYRQVGREYFARSPGSNVWVWFGDLPEATREVLWGKHKRSLAFPAGLEGIGDLEANEQS